MKYICKRCHAVLVKKSSKWVNVNESEPSRVKPTTFCPRCGGNRIELERNLMVHQIKPLVSKE